MAEKEYIEKGELLKTFREGYELPIAPGVATAYWTRVVKIKDALIEFVEKTTQADVVEVVHARWITEENTEGYRGDPHCTACKGILGDEAVYGHTPGVDSFFYCPLCGAKMDGGKDG